MPACNSTEQNAIIDRTRQLVSVYEDMAELIRLGAYRQGSDPQVDEAIHFFPAIEDFLSQTIDESTDLDTCYKNLASLLGLNVGDGDRIEPSIEAEVAAVDSTPVQSGSPLTEESISNEETESTVGLLDENSDGINEDEELH
jgi:hypothetical protein